jgi:predicted transcriptional regulator
MKISRKKTTRQNFRLEPRQKAQLKALATKHQCRMSVLIRDAIDLFLARAEGGTPQD